jgi:hypothetical protein
MYWAYLLLFMAMVVTPELTRDGFLFFSEADLEAVLIFCFGMLGTLSMGDAMAILDCALELNIREDLLGKVKCVGKRLAQAFGLSKPAQSQS